jgi:hypothetical protein
MRCRFAPGTTDTTLRAPASIESVQPWFQNCSASSPREFGLQTPRHFETAAQIGVEKIPEARIASSGARLRRARSMALASTMRLKASIIRARKSLNGSELGSAESVACGSPPRRAYRPRWSCGRVAEGGGLLNRYRVVKPYRGFESLRLRHPSP